MKTPTTIEALEGAIEMLQDIAKGKLFKPSEYHERLQSYQAARDEHHRMVMVENRAREQIRNLSRERRGA